MKNEAETPDPKKDNYADKISMEKGTSQVGKEVTRCT